MPTGIAYLRWSLTGAGKGLAIDDNEGGLATCVHLRVGTRFKTVCTYEGVEVHMTARKATGVGPTVWPSTRVRWLLTTVSKLLAGHASAADQWGCKGYVVCEVL